uniref:Uncharacterized protein n=1 Tax=Syphacia muris TaxID=451379 RepID=A0A158R437_9BILA
MISYTGSPNREILFTEPHKVCVPETNNNILSCKRPSAGVITGIKQSQIQRRRTTVLSGSSRNGWLLSLMLRIPYLTHFYSLTNFKTIQKFKHKLPPTSIVKLDFGSFANGNYPYLKAETRTFSELRNRNNVEGFSGNSSATQSNIMPFDEITYHADYSNTSIGSSTLGRKAKQSFIPLGTFYGDSKKFSTLDLSATGAEPAIPYGEYATISNRQKQMRPSVVTTISFMGKHATS